MPASGVWGNGPRKVSRAEGLWLLEQVWGPWWEGEKLDPASPARYEPLDQKLLVGPPRAAVPSFLPYCCIPLTVRWSSRNIRHPHAHEKMWPQLLPQETRRGTANQPRRSRKKEMFKVRGETNEMQHGKAIGKIMKAKADFSRSIKLIKLYPDVATEKERRHKLSVS